MIYDDNESICSRIIRHHTGDIVQSNITLKCTTNTLVSARFSSVATLHQYDDSYWTSRRNSLELIELTRINKVSLVLVSCCSNNGLIKDDPNLTSGKNSLELIELSSINKVSLV